jgi:hypothetical protein
MTNTLKTHEPHQPALSEAFSLLCSVGSSNTVLCAEDSYWDKKGGAPNILHNNNAVDTSTIKPRAFENKPFEDKLREALKPLLLKYRRGDRHTRASMLKALDKAFVHRQKRRLIEERFRAPCPTELEKAPCPTVLVEAPSRLGVEEAPSVMDVTNTNTAIPTPRIWGSSDPGEAKWGNDESNGGTYVGASENQQ